MLPRRTLIQAGFFGIACSVLLAPAGYAQETITTQPATTVPADPDASEPIPMPADAPEGATAITFRVIEINGDAKWAPLDGGEYQPVKLDDAYPPRTKIITGVRSSVKLQVGDEEPYTCMLIDSVGKTILSEAYKTDTTKSVRVGVGYGRVTAGVAEGGLQSDFTVDCPIATLSKRGTWGFTMFYERGTDFWEVGLANRGLVEALNRISGQRRTVRPAEVVVAGMRKWLEQAQFDKNVAVPDELGQEDVMVAYNRIQNEGLGVTGPGGGRVVMINLTNQAAAQDFARFADRLLQNPRIVDIGGNLRREGFFGSGRGDDLIEVLIDANSPMSQKGYAQPGTYRVRRGALEGWLKQHRQAGRD